MNTILSNLRCLPTTGITQPMGCLRVGSHQMDQNRRIAPLNATACQAAAAAATAIGVVKYRLQSSLKGRASGMFPAFYLASNADTTVEKHGLATLQYFPLASLHCSGLPTPFRCVSIPPPSSSTSSSSLEEQVVPCNKYRLHTLRAPRRRRSLHPFMCTSRSPGFFHTWLITASKMLHGGKGGRGIALLLIYESVRARRRRRSLSPSHSLDRASHVCCKVLQPRRRKATSSERGAAGRAPVEHWRASSSCCACGQ